ncbi:hypothetical protein L7F22_068873 [Adiantum nelumboides]|nr:hypothetical protein [Adiantum nelumboides]
MESAEELRQKGNACYEEGISQEKKLAPCIRISKLQAARALYLRALEASLSSAQKAAACKNLGAAHLQLANLAPSDPHINPSFYLSRSSSYFCEALSHGFLARSPPPWITFIETQLSDIASCVVADASAVASLCGSDKQKLCKSDAFETLVGLCGALSKLASNAPRDALVVAYIGQASCLVNVTSEGLRTSPSPCIEECTQDFQRCLSLLSIAEQATTSAQNAVLQRLHDRISAGQRFCECIQSIRAGAKFAKQASEATSPSQKIDYALGAIDMYKEAETNSRGLDIEAQAIVLFSVGKIYEEILRSPLQAIVYYRRALEMDLNDEDLRARAKAVLHKLELQVSRDGDGEVERRKRKLQVELKGDLDEIQRQSSLLDGLSFLKFIDTTYPPLKNTEEFTAALQCCTSSASSRSLMRKAIKFYHPDVNVSSDEQWQVVAEEITKCLLLKYNTCKGSAD